MRDTPDAVGLLNVAREVVRTVLVPGLPASRRYEGLMVANALAIAARQFEAATFSEREEREWITAFLSDGGSAPPRGDESGSERSTLIAANQRLCEEIRAGRYDPGQPLANKLMEQLRCTTRAKLAESNPKAIGP